MRDLVKIYRYETEKHMIGIIPIQTICQEKLEKQIGRKDFTILNITEVDDDDEMYLNCYVDYEFWRGR